MQKNYKEMVFRLVTEEDGWGVYYCLNTKQFYTRGRRYELIIEFNPVLLEENERKYRKLYKEKSVRGVCKS